jgi:hypothetical protein
MTLEPTMVVKLQHKLDKLRAEHRDLNREIEELSESVGIEDLRIHRLKKHKLHLKDLIAQIEALMVPDIIA